MIAAPGAEPLPFSLAPGAVVGDKYRIERVLGKGGMGLVVEARHLALDEQVALKFLLPAYATSPEASARFLREARTVFKLKSEHVARVMDVATLENGAPYMVLEFLDGDDLMRVLKTRGRLPVEDAIDYVIQACDAIGEAHANGIVHRDVKPSNLFLTVGRDGSPIVKVLDFGISKVAGTPGIDALTRTSTTMGSCQYMSPEQMQSLRDVDHRTDIYALGITLFTLLTGKYPYSGGSVPAVYAAILTGAPAALRSFRPDVGDQLAGVVEKAYQRDPRARYQSIAELVFALAPHAPARSKGALDRIARLVGRPAIAPAREEAWIPPLGEAPAADASDLARTRLMPERRSLPADGAARGPGGASKAILVVMASLAALALLAGAGAVLLRSAGVALPGIAATEPMTAAAPPGAGDRESPEPEPATVEPAAEPSAAPAEPSAAPAEPSGAVAAQAPASAPATAAPSPPGSTAPRGPARPAAPPPSSRPAAPLAPPPAAPPTAPAPAKPSVLDDR